MRVSIECDLQIARSVASQILPRVVARLAEESKDGTITLGAAVRDAHGALARVDVPVVIESNGAAFEPGAELTLAVRARSATSAFPQFSGTIELSSAEPARTHVVLRGAYGVPLGAFGAALNAIAFHPVAQESLRRLLVLIAERVMESIAQQSDIDYRAGRGG